VDKYSVISDPTRRKIIEVLANHGPLSATDISNEFQVSPSAISQHLKVLREAKLVRMDKKAQQRIYQINPQALQELEEWPRHIAQLWNERFDALEAVLRVEMLKATKNQEKGEINDRKPDKQELY
jgi:DNA-binding transcriptional ArsR family regulator